MLTAEIDSTIEALHAPALLPVSGIHDRVSAWKTRHQGKPYLELGRTIDLLERKPGLQIPPSPGPIRQPAPLTGAKALALLRSINTDCKSGKKLGPFPRFSFSPIGFTSVFNVPKPGAVTPEGFPEYRTIINCSQETILRARQKWAVELALKELTESRREWLAAAAGQKGGENAVVAEVKIRTGLKTTSNDQQEKMPMPIDMPADFVKMAWRDGAVFKADLRKGFKQLLASVESASALTFELAITDPRNQRVHRWWYKEPTAPQGARVSPPSFNEIVRSLLRIAIDRYPPVFSRIGRRALEKHLNDAFGRDWTPDDPKVLRVVEHFCDNLEHSARHFRKWWKNRTLGSFLDDIFGTSSDVRMTNLAWFCLQRESEPLGVAWNPEKLRLAETSQIILGVLLNFKEKFAQTKPGFASRIRAKIARIRKTWGSASFCDDIEELLGDLVWGCSLLPRTYCFLGLLTEVKLTWRAGGGGRARP